jgi:hypothetical protein
MPTEPMLRSEKARLDSQPQCLTWSRGGTRKGCGALSSMRLPTLLNYGNRNRDRTNESRHSSYCWMTGLYTREA